MQYVAGAVSASVAAATAGLATAIATKPSSAANTHNTRASHPPHFPELIDSAHTINMYHAPIITTNIPTPVRTNMYSMNKIL